VQIDGLQFEAESPSGRRNRIGTVVVTPLDLSDQEVVETPQRATADGG